ncbi:tetratricopeptide repeat protein [Erythrobacter sp. CCH5-A1]|uniref:tetratricopeptide repeat protein n=1 Tax=Erythrobacter sp. CCH5-A1 TaxID=1768792 RepID=UPI00082EA17E|nr:tetratricopeptide repeat protein [Erythrobacter sp. CCH5-A1]
MADNDDLTGLFPDPPPPDGDRRSKAIEAALRRFDEAHAQPDADNGTMPPASPAAPNRTKFAVLASAALVVMVTVPLLMTQRFGPDSLVQAPPPSASERVTTFDVAEPPALDEAPPPLVFEAAPADAVAPPQPMIAPPAVAPPAENRADAAAPQVAGAAPLAIQPSTPPRAAMREESAERADPLVVTGSRVSRSEAAEPVRDRRRAATGRQIRVWQECTVADERRNARLCAARLGTAPGAEEIARGLRLAFRGEDADAAKAFDRALAAAPGSTGALLNRALVRQRLGDLDGARADLDRAIRSSPGDARSYYFRSLLLRRSGDRDGADDDLQKAIDLAGGEARKR